MWQLGHRKREGRRTANEPLSGRDYVGCRAPRGGKLGTLSLPRGARPNRRTIPVCPSQWRGDTKPRVIGHYEFWTATVRSLNQSGVPMRAIVFSTVIAIVLTPAIEATAEPRLPEKVQAVLESWLADRAPIEKA